MVTKRLLKPLNYPRKRNFFGGRQCEESNKLSDTRHKKISSSLEPILLQNIYPYINIFHN